jgi:signal transduction histidine kinase
LFKRQAWPVRVRLVAVASGIAALVCIAMSVLGLFTVHGRASDFKVQRATNAQFEIVNLMERAELPRVLPYYHTNAIQVLNEVGAPVASTPQLVGKPPIAHFRPGPHIVSERRVLCPPSGLDRCETVVSATVPHTGGDWTIYATTTVVPWYLGWRAVTFCIGLSAVAVALTGFATRRTVNKTLEPIMAMRKQFTEIEATDMSRRLPVPEANDEFRSLTRATNALLDRLEGSVKQLQRFTSDASHDLRSPITAMRAGLEEALLHPDETDWPKTAQGVLDSLDRLQAIVTDLLTLARLDAGGPHELDSIDLPGLVSAELKRYERGKEVKTDFQPQVTVVGDRLRLNRLLTNLLDNAERHAKSQIKVSVRADGEYAILEVQDDGVGIAPEDRDVVFQRFARLEAARHKDVNGTGLGLPIAREIANAHGGSLTIEDSPVGARFVCRLPLHPDT